jgi:GNAT superfamily N-acetyltransferase
MNPIPAAIERLRFAVRRLPGVLSHFSEAESEQRPSPARWTKKEVIGHLIDSASNNHQRLVRGQLAGGQYFPGYEQEQWVRIQNYQAARWIDLIDLWRAYNFHLLHVAEYMSEEGQRATCQVGGESQITLAELFGDYVDHLEHHLRKMLGRWDSEAVTWELRRVANLSSDEQSALRTLSLAMYPPETTSTWPGHAIEWASAQWSVIGWDASGEALCHVGIILREALWNQRPVKVGGIGGVKTHPASRKRGFATTAIQRALDFFREQGDVDFALLVCEPALIPFYERVGWRRFPGDLFVTQKQATIPFTFNLPMTVSIRLRESLGGRIDLLGPPW